MVISRCGGRAPAPLVRPARRVQRAEMLALLIDRHNLRRSAAGGGGPRSYCVSAGETAPSPALSQIGGSATSTGPSDEDLERVMREVPRGAFALAALTVGLLLAGW